MDNIVKPNLFLVGAMKSGTTSLHNYIDMHPDAFMSKVPWKEPRYFVKEANFNKGLDWYLSLFEEGKGAKIVGESSTDYTKAPNYAGVPERLKEFSPDARIIYIMRDPIERAISQYWWEVNWCGEGRDMLPAIQKNNWITYNSNYALQLQPYIDIFGMDKIYILTTESMKKDIVGEVIKVYRWLGLDPDEVEFSGTVKKYNKSKPMVNKLWGASWISQLRGGPIWNAVKFVSPPPLRRKMLDWFSRPVERKDSDADRQAVIDFLRPSMQKQTEELSKMLGRDFKEWTTLY